MKTSAVITVYNRPEMLAACLQALALNSAQIDEAVVSDDGSTPENATRMQAIFDSMPFPVKYVNQPDRGYRLAAARNNAIRVASGDYLLMLDCDILLMPNTVALHLQNARPGVFLAANRALAGREDTQKALQAPLNKTVLDMLWDNADRSHLSRAHRKFLRNAFLRRLGLARSNKPKILGCHFSLFRKDAERINGFDEHFEGWGLEDDDFALRLHKAGIVGRSLIMRARAVHLWHPSVDSHPCQLRESRNFGYYKRADIPAFCERGLTH